MSDAQVKQSNACLHDLHALTTPPWSQSSSLGRQRTARRRWGASSQAPGAAHWTRRWAPGTRCLQVCAALMFQGKARTMHAGRRCAQAQLRVRWRRNQLCTNPGPRGAPLRMLRMVPLGLRHICFSPNSFTRASSGVIVAHCRTGAACLVYVRVCEPGRAAHERFRYQAWYEGSSTGCTGTGNTP